MISDNIEYEINTQPLPSKESFFSADNDSLKGGSHLKKVSEMRPGCTPYVLLTAKS
jgi:hypothetical protein